MLRQTAYVRMNDKFYTFKISWIEFKIKFQLCSYAGPSIKVFYWKSQLVHKIVMQHVEYISYRNQRYQMAQNYVAIADKLYLKRWILWIAEERWLFACLPCSSPWFKSGSSLAHARLCRSWGWFHLEWHSTRYKKRCKKSYKYIGNKFVYASYGIFLFSMCDTGFYVR